MHETCRFFDAIRLDIQHISVASLNDNRTGDLEKLKSFGPKKWEHPRILSPPIQEKVYSTCTSPNMRHVATAVTEMRILDDGRLQFRVRRKVLRGVTTKMLVWWFSDLDGDL